MVEITPYTKHDNDKSNWIPLTTAATSSSAALTYVPTKFFDIILIFNIILDIIFLIIFFNIIVKWMLLKLTERNLVALPSNKHSL
mmetsp:Transcript_12522/g.30588  ORF Transcript_12522/g.30588 Transcript_12522/m.30588 type:complete len:85 (+) Transcript_12522:227-481(+)